MPLLLALTSADAALSGALIFLWFQRRRYRFALYWGIGQIFLALNTISSAFGVGFAAAHHEGFPFELIPALCVFFFAIYFYWRGTSLFCGTKTNPRMEAVFFSVAPAAILASNWFGRLFPEWGASLALSATFLACGVIVCRHHKEFRFVGWLFLLRAFTNVAISFYFYGGQLTAQIVAMAGVAKLLMALSLIYAVVKLHLRRTECIADSIASGFMLIDGRGCIELANSRMRDMLCLPKQGLVGQPLARFFPNSRVAVGKEGSPGRGVEFPFCEEIDYLRCDGQSLPLALHWGTYGENFERMHLLQVFDERKRKMQESALKSAAQTDPVTGLFNRAGLIRGLSSALAASTANGSECAVIFIDLDHFNRINDSFGHSVGDKLLRLVAERLTCMHGEGCVLARFGGDEFVLVASGLAPTPDHLEAIRAAERVLSVFDRTFDLDNLSLVSSASLGIAVAPLHGSDAETLLKSADQAMYAAKAGGRRRIALFDEQMRTTVRDAVLIDEALRNAIADDEFRLVFQPIVASASGEWVKAEALIRWTSAKLGAVSPDRFIPVAEENGLIVEIGNWVLHEACRVARSWIDATGRETRIAVNISALQLLDQRFPAHVESALKVSGLSAHLLELEITERVLIDDESAVAAVIQTLKALGVAFALDDFGTGYSALSYLHRFPLDALKIDRSFILALEHNPKLQALVGAIVSMAGALGLKTIAEGVETEAQASLLRQAGCSHFQGWLFAKPLTSDEIVSGLMRDTQ